MSQLTLARAKEILAKHTTEAHLFVHAAAVSAAMGAMAEYFQADKEHWEAIGYLHDVDYEDIDTIIAHGYGVTTDEIEPVTDIAKSLFAVDELTGIVHAYALMRPEGLDGMEVKSLKKKFKDKRFAAKCDRELIRKGFGMLRMDGGVVMERCIAGMQAHKAELGFGADQV